MSRKRLALAAGALLCAVGLVLFAGGGWIHAKAWLAQILLERAWATRLDGAVPSAVRPWPWADTAPVARMVVPRLGVDRIVLSAASGRTLAFGPARLEGTAAPGARGNSLLTGHRDTHFAFLRNLELGDLIHLQAADGAWIDYRVTGSKVFDTRTARLEMTPERRSLTLVTCYPFDAVVPGGPLRYAVFAEAVPSVAMPGRNAPPARHAAHGGTDRPG